MTPISRSKKGVSKHEKSCSRQANQLHEEMHLIGGDRLSAEAKNIIFGVALIYYISKSNPKPSQNAMFTR